MTDTKKLKDQIQQDIQKVIRKINLDCNYYEDLQSEYDADSDELAVELIRIRENEIVKKIRKNLMKLCKIEEA